MLTAIPRASRSPSPRWPPSPSNVTRSMASGTTPSHPTSSRHEAVLPRQILRGGDLGNVARLLRHLPSPLQDRTLVDLRSGELRSWRDGLLQQLQPATVNRTANALKAALNLAADQHESIASRQAWEKGLSALPDASVARNVILPEPVVRQLVRAAYAQSHSLGLLVEVAAVTGARYSQIARLRVQDLQIGGDSPRSIDDALVKEGAWGEKGAPPPSADPVLARPEA